MSVSRYLAALLLCLFISIADAEDSTLSIATWGGVYEQAQQAVIFTPFTTQSNIAIKTLPYNGGIAILQQPDKPDLIDMTEEDSLRACELGLLHEYNFRALVKPSPSGRAIRKDFLRQAFRPCSIAHLSFSTVVAYSLDAFPEAKPQTIADFFDLERFPGKRGLRKEPAALFEWALIARGVPINQVYDLLSTERGLRLATDKLDSIREHIVWWDDPDQPLALLKAGTVAMASAYNGRLFNAQEQHGSIVILWDAQIIELSTWVMPKQGKVIKPEVLEFIRYATSARTQALLAEQIPYGPTRYSAFAYIGKNPGNGLVMVDHLPNTPHHLPKALFKDSKWSANTARLRQQAFVNWLKQSE